MGALTLLHQRVFDWLDDVVKVPQQSRLSTASLS